LWKYSTRGVWIISRIFHHEILYTVTFIIKKNSIFAENVPYFMLHLVFYVLLYFDSRFLILLWQEALVLFLFRNTLRFEAYWYCVCTIRSNCGTVRDSGTANRRRPELRRVLKVLDIAPRRRPPSAAVAGLILACAR